MDHSLVIGPAESAADLREVHNLFVEYQRWLGFDLCFQGFAEEVAGLPGAYAPPRGALLLARDSSGAVAGGVGMRPLAEEVCEMKRLFVRDTHRGRGVGRRLAREIIEAGRMAGYLSMRLDTLTRLEEALMLYRSIGFVEIAPYSANPQPDVVYMELRLSQDAGGCPNREIPTRAD